MKLAAVFSYQRKLGCSEHQANSAATALHPLDGSRRPVSKQVEKEIRKKSRHFAKLTRKVSGATELAEYTDVALSEYARIARFGGDQYYTDVFTNAWLGAMVDMSDQRRDAIRSAL